MGVYKIKLANNIKDDYNIKMYRKEINSPRIKNLLKNKSLYCEYRNKPFDTRTELLRFFEINIFESVARVLKIKYKFIIIETLDTPLSIEFENTLKENNNLFEARMRAVALKVDNGKINLYNLITFDIYKNGEELNE